MLSDGRGFLRLTFPVAPWDEFSGASAPFCWLGPLFALYGPRRLFALIRTLRVQVIRSYGLFVSCLAFRQRETADAFLCMDRRTAPIRIVCRAPFGTLAILNRNRCAGSPNFLRTRKGFKWRLAQFFHMEGG